MKKHWNDLKKSWKDVKKAGTIDFFDGKTRKKLERLDFLLERLVFTGVLGKVSVAV